jgi:hypothetical protein
MKYLSLAALLVVCLGFLGFTGCEPLNKISSWCGCSASSSEAVADDSAAADDSAEVADDVADDSSDDSDSTDS